MLEQINGWWILGAMAVASVVFIYLWSRWGLGVWEQYQTDIRTYLLENGHPDSYDRDIVDWHYSVGNNAVQAAEDMVEYQNIGHC